MTPNVLRVTSLYLRDPHFYLAGVDITDQPLLGQSVNGTLIPDGFTMDYDHDGFVDVSFLLLFRPLDPSAATAGLELINGNCAVSDPTRCGPKGSPTATFTIENASQGTCLDTVAGTTSGFQPPVSTPSGPCFATQPPTDLVINPGGIAIPMKHARLAATYQGNPPLALMSGLIAGFLTKTDAAQTLLPAYLGAPLGGTPLTNYLDATQADLAESPTGEDGYWLYMNFVAQPVVYSSN